MVHLGEDVLDLLGVSVASELAEHFGRPLKDGTRVVGLTIRRQDLTKRCADHSNAFGPAEPHDDLISLSNARDRLASLFFCKIEPRQSPQSGSNTVGVVEPLIDR